MDYNVHLRFAFADQTFVSRLKRDVEQAARGYGFNDTETGKVNLVVTEMASNVIKHAGTGGEMLVKPLSEEGTVTGLELICLDAGAGMADTRKMQEDGVSTYGSSGEGLGAIKRLSDEYDLYSVKGTGTAVLARLYKTAWKRKSKAPQNPGLAIGTVMLAKSGETLCGDNWAIRGEGDKYMLLVADGLGHGALAHQASGAAAETFQKTGGLTPMPALRKIHDALKRTRGAVVQVLTIDQKQGRLTYCGVGNISGKLFGLETKNIISYNGIVGHNMPHSLNDHQLPWTHGSLLVMHSDGLNSRWDLAKFPQIGRHDPALAAAMLYKHFSRQTDDIVVLVARNFM